MSTIMYGSLQCAETRAAVQYIEEHKLDVVFKNFDGCLANMKEFVLLRDRSPEFDVKKKNCLMGVPCFLKEDGKILFDVKSI